VSESEAAEPAGAPGATAPPAADATPRLAPGVAFWLAVGAAYVAADVAGLTDDLFVPAPLMVALVLGRAVDVGVGAARTRRLLAALVVAGSFALAGLVWARDLDLFGIEPGLVLVALVAAGTLTLAGSARRVREPFLRALGLHPTSAVHAVTAVALVLTLVGSVLLFIALQDEPETTIPFYPTEPLAALLGDAALAFAGVGLFLTRRPRQALARLDLRRLRLRQLGTAVLLAAAFHVAVGVMEYAESRLLPAVHAREERFQYEFVGLSPILGGLLVSVAAGVGEELLFRGALQPRLGIVVSSLLFASLHVQYQIPGILMIFVVSLALGALKERTSTTYTMCVHVFYDIGAFALPGL
jgi:membrane protease YdiL (CAAX protease family)